MKSVILHQILYPMSRGSRVVCALPLLALSVAQAQTSAELHPLPNIMGLDSSISVGMFVPKPVKGTNLVECCAVSTLDPSPLVSYYRTAPNLGANRSSILVDRLRSPIPLYAVDPGAQVELPLLSTDSLAWYRAGKIRQLSDPEIMYRLYGGAMWYLQQKHPEYFEYRGRPQVMADSPIGSLITGAQPILIKEGAKPVENAEISAVQGGRELRTRYWLPSLETSAQLSQNYISANWHQGGTSNLNLNTRLFVTLKYTRDRWQWMGELEDKLSIYDTRGDMRHKYSVSEDVFRLRNTLGLRSLKSLYYTWDTEFTTQLTSTYKPNSDFVRSAFLAPATLNTGLGMKYEFAHRGRAEYGQRIRGSVSLAPISYTYRWSRRSDIDLERHGLSVDQLHYQRWGSTLRATLNWDFSVNLSWYSRLYVNTTFSRLETEWENTLNMSISRYFSTRINLTLRYDDGVAPWGEGWRKYLQTYELLSFGVSYRL